MKKIILSFGFILFSFPIFSANEHPSIADTAKFPNEKGAVLLDELKEGKVYGSLEKLADKKHAKKARLIGHLSFDVPKDKKLAGNKFVLIGWLGVQNTNDVSKVVMFKEPIVSSFIIKNDSDAIGVSLPTFGEKAHLETALADLEMDKIDSKSFKEKKVIKAPIGTGSHSLLPVKNVQRKNNVSKSESVDPLSESEPSLVSPLNTTDGDASALFSVDLPQGSKNGSSTYNHTNSAYAPFGQSLPPSTGFEFNGLNGQTVPSGGGANPALDPSRTNFRSSQDPKFFNNNSAEQGQRNPPDLGPNITVELTEEGCMPEHDALQERVTIMARAKKSENGRVIEEGICEKTLEVYEVKKDYLCEGCQDEVNIDDRKAYARYMEYWIDRTQQRHNLGIKLDRGVPFDFFEDKKACGFDTETEEGVAIRMSKLGYLNKFRTFKVVQDCRVIEGAEQFPIHKTVRNCEPIHNFAERISHEQKRSFFTVDRVEHEVSPCHPVEPSLPHDFLITGCYPIVDRTTFSFTNTARRRIKTSNGWKIISEECEPCDNHSLEITREGCEGEYVHDVITMKSYLKKRYYFPRGHNHREFVTACLRTDEFIEQQTESNGIYEHDDTAKISRPRLSLYILGDGGRINVQEAKVRGQLGQVAYVLARNEDRPTADIYYEGCFRRTPTQSVNIYTRGDGSLYEEIIGPGKLIVSKKDECTHRVETGNDEGWFGVYLKDRTISVNPHGAVQIGPWVPRPWHGSCDNGSGSEHSKGGGRDR